LSLWSQQLQDEKEDSGIGTLWIDDKKTIQQMVELDYSSYRKNNQRYDKFLTTSRNSPRK
jgi:hypothetical protein